ncbi:MAG: hypothetical protein ABF479_11220 [Gluconacetobacter sp.]
MLNNLHDKAPLAAGVSVVCLSVAACAFSLYIILAGSREHMDKNTAAITAMVHDGASPIAASCAVGRTDAREAVCIAEMARETGHGQ